MSELRLAGRVIKLSSHYNRPGEPAVCTSCGKDMGFVSAGEEDFGPGDEIEYCDECFEEAFNENQN